VVSALRFYKKLSKYRLKLFLNKEI